MKLDNYIDINNILSDIVYTRDGKDVNLDIRAMCTIDDSDELDQLRSISGNVYFLIKIQTQIAKKKNIIENELLKTKNKLIQLKGTIYLTTSNSLAQSKARVTEKVLESRINEHTDIAEINNIFASLSVEVAHLSCVENELKGAIKALILKQEALVEISRRHKQEINTINKLS